MSSVRKNGRYLEKYECYSTIYSINSDDKNVSYIGHINGYDIKNGNGIHAALSIFNLFKIAEIEIAKIHE